MCLDFFPDDYDVLQEIISAVPRLQKLKLLEEHRSTVRRILIGTEMNSCSWHVEEELALSPCLE